MKAADNPRLQQLIDASARDEQTLAFPVPDEIFGFHAQQAAEKLYKALITANGEEHPFTHSLEILVMQLEKLGEQLPALPITADELTAYAVESRYVDGKPLPLQLRGEMLTALAALRTFVQHRAVALKSAGAEVRS